jgi:hypothetical protein
MQVDFLQVMNYQTFLDAWTKTCNNEDMYTKDGLNLFLQEHEHIIHLYLHHIPLVKPNGTPLETIDGVRALIHYSHSLIKRDNGQPHDLHTIEPKKVIKPLLKHSDDKDADPKPVITAEPTKPKDVDPKPTTTPTTTEPAKPIKKTIKPKPKQPVIKAEVTKVEPKVEPNVPVAEEPKGAIIHDEMTYIVGPDGTKIPAPLPSGHEYHAAFFDTDPVAVDQKPVEEVKADEVKVVEVIKNTDEEAKQKADDEAKQKAADDEAKQKAADDEAKQQPVVEDAKQQPVVEEVKQPVETKDETVKADEEAKPAAEEAKKTSNKKNIKIVKEVPKAGNGKKKITIVPQKQEIDRKQQPDPTPQPEAVMVAMANETKKSIPAVMKKPLPKKLAKKN